MATYTALDLTSKPLAGVDQAAVYFGTIAPGTATATADLLRPCRLPSGLKVAALMVNVRTAFGATAPASIGFANTDGSALDATAYPAPATQIAAATDTTFATTGLKMVMPQAGVFVTVRESFLQILFGTVATGAAGTADVVVFGEFVGSR
jgi:hypothetical protein